MHWLSIENAPKDVELLLYCPGTGVVRGRWHDDACAKKPQPYWSNDRQWLLGARYTRNNQPTHYMPLPAPPAPPRKRRVRNAA